MQSDNNFRQSMLATINSCPTDSLCDQPKSVEADVPALSKWMYSVILQTSI